MDMTMLSVREFHDAFDAETPDEPVSLVTSEAVMEELAYLAEELENLARFAHDAAADNGGDNTLMRCQLMIEELGECVRAMYERDMVAVLDALCDMRYVADGTALSLGLGPVFLAAFREVHASNMTKLGDDGKPIKNEAGRVVKGPRYRRPNLEPLLKGAGS